MVPMLYLNNIFYLEINSLIREKTESLYLFRQNLILTDIILTL